MLQKLKNLLGQSEGAGQGVTKIFWCGLRTAGPQHDQQSPEFHELAQLRGFDVAMIAGGHDHSVFLTTEGGVYTIGKDTLCGVGASQRVTFMEAQRVDVPSKVVHVAASYQHSLLVTVQGEVYSFGTASGTALGPSGGYAYSPYRIEWFGSDPTKNERFAIMAAADTSGSAVLTRNNEIIHFIGTPYTVHKLPPEEVATSLSLAGSTVMVATEKGTVYSSATGRFEPWGQQGDLHILTVDSRGDHFLFLAGMPSWSVETHKRFPKNFKESTKAFLMCHQVGRDRKAYHPECQLHTLPIELIHKIIEYTAAAIGSAWIWGPYQPLTQIPVEGHNIVSICSGYSHSLMVTDEGVVLGYGNDHYGQLGVASGSTRGTKVAIAPSLKGIVAKKAYAGSYTSYVVTESK